MYLTLRVGITLRLRAFNSAKWRLERGGVGASASSQPPKRIGNDFDCRFQSLDPILAIAAVHILFAVAEQITPDIPIDGRPTIWPKGVAQDRSHDVAMAVESLFDPDRLVQPLIDNGSERAAAATVGGRA